MLAAEEGLRGGPQAQFGNRSESTLSENHQALLADLLWPLAFYFDETK